MIEIPTAGDSWGHHDGSPAYVSNPAPAIGDRVDVFLRTPADAGLSAVHVRTTPDGEPHYTQGRVDRTVNGETWWRTTVTVRNAETSYRFLLRTSAGTTRSLNALGSTHREVTDAADFRLTTYPPPPAWSQDAVVYQIFPDRFARSEQHPLGELPDWAIPAEWDTPVAFNTPDGVRQIYGGSLWGVAEKLDHIAELGANVVYLTPFFPAESNHRYDASTFDRVDPLLGGDQALRELVGQAHRRGMKVMGDITLNHSGSGHDWFRRGQADPASQDADFYYFGEDRKHYAAFFDEPTLPKFDHRSAELRRRLYAGPYSVIARYLSDFDLDGWRVDVAQAAGRHGAVDLNAEMARLTRQTMAWAKPESLLIAEHQFDASASLRGDGWHGTMAYAGFTRPIWSWLATRDLGEFWGAPGRMPIYDGTDMALVMREFAALISWTAQTHNMTLLDSHDSARFVSMAGAERQRLGAALQFTLPGIPMIFSGDEVGVPGVHLEDSRRPFPWTESAWDRTTYDVYRRLLALRRNHPALRHGGLRWLRTGTDVVLFERLLPAETILVQVSRADHEPIKSAFAATSLTGGADLLPGAAMPSDGPAFHIWLVDV